MSCIDGDLRSKLLRGRETSQEQGETSQEQGTNPGLEWRNFRSGASYAKIDPYGRKGSRNE